MEAKNINLKTATMEQLKSAAYDVMVNIANLQNGLNQIQQEIAMREMAQNKAINEVLDKLPDKDKKDAVKHKS